MDHVAVLAEGREIGVGFVGRDARPITYDLAYDLTHGHSRLTWDRSLGLRCIWPRSVWRSSQRERDGCAGPYDRCRIAVWDDLSARMVLDLCDGLRPILHLPSRPFRHSPRCASGAWDVERLPRGYGSSLSALTTHLRGGVSGRNTEKRFWHRDLAWPQTRSFVRSRLMIDRARISSATAPTRGNHRCHNGPIRPSHGRSNASTSVRQPHRIPRTRDRDGGDRSNHSPGAWVSAAKHSTRRGAGNSSDTHGAKLEQPGRKRETNGNQGDQTSGALPRSSSGVVRSFEAIRGGRGQR